MDSRERVLAVLAGEKPDRPPFGFWCHFPPDRISGTAAVDAHVKQHEAHQTDFIKVMNDNPYPHTGLVRAAEELAQLRPLKGEETGFGEQLELIAALRARVGERVLLVTTIFNAWAVLRTLIRPPAGHNPPEMESADAPSDWLLQAHDEAPEALDGALGAVSESLSRFAGRCIDAGADGIFLSVRDDWVDRRDGEKRYAQMVAPHDLRILEAARAGRFNILHVCGRTRDLTQFSSYPAHAINWADRAAGPSIREAIDEGIRPAICCGVDNLGTMARGRPDELRAQVADALKQAGDRPMIIAPGCTFNPDLVSDEMLQALGEAVRSGRGA